jgi:hypothetical protein
VSSTVPFSIVSQQESSAAMLTQVAKVEKENELLADREEAANLRGSAKLV